MRALTRPFATHNVYFPIESIVFVFVLATLAYFHILSGIKHSSFFAPTYPTNVRPAHARLSGDEWLGVTQRDWLDAAKHPKDAVKALELQQIVFRLDDKERTVRGLRPWSDSPSDMHCVGVSNVDPTVLSEIVEHLPSQLTGLNGDSYSSVCYYPGLNVTATPCFVTRSADSSASVLTLSFVPGAREDWLASLHQVKSVTVDNVEYDLVGAKREETIGEMKSSKWVAYAVHATILRFWELTKKADSLDIIVVLLGYVLMHATFIRLWLSSRALGSNFWLSTGIFSSSLISFLFTLPLCRYLNIPLDPIALTEALPFLVCTVGFDKPLRLAKAVLAQPQALKPQEDGRMIPAGEVVLEALDRVGNLILRDYALEIAVLLVGVNSGVGGLKEFCSVAAVALGMDCLMLCTIYTAVLTLMVEVRRVKKVRQMNRSRSNSLGQTSGGIRPALSKRPTANAPTPKTTGERLSAAVLGVKGSLLPETPGGKVHPADENPMYRLKLLLIASFLTLHILNFITPLTSASASTRHHKHSVRTAADALPPAPLVDITSPAISSILKSLALAEKAGLESSETDSESELLVKVAAPAYLRILPAARHSGSKAEAIENFMSSWSDLVGDPVLSKWIVVLLGLSVALNGYLLRGIAAGSGLAAMKAVRDKGVRFRSRVRSRVRPEREEPEETEPAPEPVAIHAPVAPVTFVAAATVPPAHLREAAIRAPLTPAETSSPTSDPESSPFRKESSRVSTRTLEECIEIFENGPKPVSVALSLLNDEEVILLAQNGKIAPYALEKVLGDLERAVHVRRALISRASKTKTLEYSDVPMSHFDYSRNVIGYMPIPLGVAGPLKIDGELFPIPMATAEGTLVASTSRGCKALNAGGGVTTVLTYDAMTRGPAIDFPQYSRSQARAWEAFESTSRFAKLQNINVRWQDDIVHGRPCTLGNYCTDKKPAAINWIEGRGKSIVAEAVIPGKVVKSVLKTTVDALCNLNTKKNLLEVLWQLPLVGSTRMQRTSSRDLLGDWSGPAQNVESSQCMTLMEALAVTVTMPCIEVGTVGGGTVLPPTSCTEMLGVKGAHPTNPGQNAQQLARIIASAVMAGELSLISALAAGHLVRAHMAHNRSQANTQANTPAVSRPETPAILSPNTSTFWNNVSKGVMTPMTSGAHTPAPVQASGYSIDAKTAA
ncbi:uncharacterized protein B0H18DRAFT_1088202 [Fomitopsis serialis]|uniref:uncharacterized protein n=1 Tax=Fomitopsis serialis TaxID=139415 RepID=UPI002007A549|nr:uncharacterized protein B0H18DRAFT_1088202 [Neoantrodia serialis]KAH9913104.1 hypothetical protein B0H18DRAFT_1088202 [Neoantrodia serialis]